MGERRKCQKMTMLWKKKIKVKKKCSGWDLGEKKKQENGEESYTRGRGIEGWGKY